MSQDTTSVSGGERPKRVRPHVLAAAYVVLVACLVTLRATISRLGFLSFGWILVIAVVPLLPWLLPMLAPLLQRVAPSVQSVKLGMLQIDLRQAQPVVAGLGVAAQTLAAAQPAPAPDFASTNAMDIIAGMAAVHEKGAGLVIVDLQDGAKWWLPNLYFLSRVLESDPFVHHLVFTEARGGTDGFFVGVCTPSDVRLRVEAALPVYATAGQQIAIPKDMSAPGADAQLANQFNALRVALTPPGSSVADEVHRPVTSAWLRRVLGPALSSTSVQASDKLSDDDVRVIVESPYRYVATTSDARFTGVIDRDPIALAVARQAIAGAA